MQPPRGGRAAAGSQGRAPSSLHSQAALGKSLKSTCWSDVMQASGGDDVKQDLEPVRVVGEGIG